MSYEARNWAWRQAEAQTIDDPLDLLILLNLADVADQYGANSYPSQSRLVTQCLSSERTIRRRLALLVERGILAVEAPATRKKPTTYRLVGVDGLAAILAAQVGDPGDGLAAIGRPLGGHWAATVLRNSSDELDLEGEGTDLGSTRGTSTDPGSTRGNSKDPRESDDVEKTRGKGSDYRFEDAWSAYPLRRGRRVGKEKAREQWKRLTYQEKGRCFKAIRTFAAERPELPPDMHRWVRDRTWQDYLEPPAGPVGAGRPGAPARKDFADMTAEEFAAVRPSLSDMELTEALDARRRAEILRAARP